MNNKVIDVKNKASKPKVNVLNYMTPTLHKRLSAIINIDFFEQSFAPQDNFDFIVSEITYDPESASTRSDREQYALLQLHVDELPEVRTAKIDNKNWMIPYKMKPETERVVWRSKLYSKEKVVSANQSLVQRTENQVDIALRKFCNWFRAVFEDERSHINEEYIKKLFSSGFEIHPAAQSIYIEPKQVYSIPHEVAEKYNVPELSTKNQKKKLMNLDRTVRIGNLPNPPSIAFGKCLPASLKKPKPEIDDNMKPNFPDELQTGEYLFKGIEELRSTKTLVKHLNKSNMVEMKPLYFKNLKYEDDEKYVPLYKKLENKM